MISWTDSGSVRIRVCRSGVISLLQPRCIKKKKGMTGGDHFRVGALATATGWSSSLGVGEWYLGVTPPGQVERSSWWLCVSEETHGSLQSRVLWYMENKPIQIWRQKTVLILELNPRNRLTHYKIRTFSSVPRIIIKKTLGRGQGKSQQCNQLRPFRNGLPTTHRLSLAWLWYADRARYSQWTMPSAGTLPPLLSCARHNTTTDGGLNTVKHNSCGIMAPSHADDALGLCRQLKHCSLPIIYKKVHRIREEYQWISALRCDPSCHWTVLCEHPVCRCHEYEKETFVPPTKGECENQSSLFPRYNYTFSD